MNETVFFVFRKKECRSTVDGENYKTTSTASKPQWNIGNKERKKKIQPPHMDASIAKSDAINHFRSWMSTLTHTHTLAEHVKLRRKKISFHHVRRTFKRFCFWILPSTKKNTEQAHSHCIECMIWYPKVCFISTRTEWNATNKKSIQLNPTRALSAPHFFFYKM